MKYYLSELVITVHSLGSMFPLGITISRILLSIGGSLPWWLTTENAELLAHDSLVWDSRLVPWIHAYDGDIQVSPRTTLNRAYKGC
jgi:hypothetical protein